MTTIREYIKKFNEKSVTGELNQKVEELKTLIVEHSPFLTMVSNYNLTTKVSYIPFVNPSNITPGTAPTMQGTLGGMDVIRNPYLVSLSLTDDTVEDANVNIELAAKQALLFQAHSFLEHKIGEFLETNLPAGTGTSPDMKTVMDTIASFPASYACLQGKFMLCMNLNTYLKVMSTLDTAHKKLLDDGLFVPVLCPTMNDGKLAVLHSYGLKLGMDIGSIEIGRDGESQSNAMLLPIYLGINIASGYGKLLTLTL